MTAPFNITLIGCGKMGGAMLHGWLNADIDATFTVIEPHDIAFDNIAHFKTIDEAAEKLRKADTIILAVKPQAMHEICTSLKNHIADDALILSIAAGQSIANFENHFGAAQPVIRAMPNTPAAIGKGMSVAVANPNVSETQKSIAQNLLECAGKFEWIDDEDLMDAVTALSGSGPAYIFYLIEVLAKSGEKIGLPPQTAQTLARQTVIGAAALAENDADTPASTLRQNVTSPCGTTEAALNILMDKRMQDLLDEALTAAKNRGKELNS